MPPWMPSGIEPELFAPRPAPVEAVPEVPESQPEPEARQPRELEPEEPEPEPEPELPEPEPEPEHPDLEPEPEPEPVEEPVAGEAEAFALDAEEVTPKWLMCSRCGQPSAQPLCEACQEAYNLLRAFSRWDDESQE